MKRKFEVKIAVWLATAIMSYEKYQEVKKKREPQLKDFYFRQVDIIRKAEKIAEGKVHSPRVGQWYNGDHENNTYNYLKSKGSLRRLTQAGEFNGKKEHPLDLRLSTELQTKFGRITIGELLGWVKKEYSSIDNKIKKTDKYNSEIKKLDIEEQPKELDEVEKVEADNKNLRNKREHLTIKSYIEHFFEAVKRGNVEIYNEFSLQHELGIYLRHSIPNNYKVQFERNVSFFDIDKSETLKKEMDIVIFNNKEEFKYCIELKYPRNGQYPESMYAIIKDIKFLEQLKVNGFTECYSITLIDDDLYKEGLKKDGIYKYFRSDISINGRIMKPTGKTDRSLIIHGTYQMSWKSLEDGRNMSIIRL